MSAIEIGRVHAAIMIYACDRCHRRVRSLRDDECAFIPPKGWIEEADKCSSLVCDRCLKIESEAASSMK